ncbi:MAG: transketolase family protein [Smithellaceae bacterium]
MRKQFKNTIMDLSLHDNRIVLIFGDVSVYLFNEFKEKYPDRFYNMGISENTLISVGAGLAAQGFSTFVHTIAPFITERSYEQIKLDMCYNRFGGNIVSCGASFDYAWDGATHHAYTDLAILRLLPGMEVIQPGSTKELDILLRSQYNNGNPTYFRLSDHPHIIDVPVKFGQGVAIRDTGAEITVMTAGPLLGNVLEACNELPVNIVYFHTIKPIDTKLIERFRNTRILVVHDAFGLKEAVGEVPEMRIVFHGMPDAFCTCYGTLQDIRRQLRLDPAGIREFVTGELKKK